MPAEHPVGMCQGFGALGSCEGQTVLCVKVLSPPSTGVF